MINPRTVVDFNFAPCVSNPSLTPGGLGEVSTGKEGRVEDVTSGCQASGHLRTSDTVTTADQLR